MKILISIFVFISSLNIYAQDTIYLNKKYKKTNQKELAQYFRIISKDSENNKLIVEQTFFMNGKIKRERKYSNYYGKKKILEKQTTWYETGQIRYKGNYKKNKMDGYFISYWENGQLKRKDSYKKGVLKEGKCWDSSGNEVEYYDFEIKPEFPGGREALILYLKENINYANIPASSKGQKVLIGFYIDTDGSIVNAKVAKSVDSRSDLEAIRVIQNMPKWKPAMQDGKSVKVKRTLPLTF